MREHQELLQSVRIPLSSQVIHQPSEPDNDSQVRHSNSEPEIQDPNPKPSELSMTSSRLKKNSKLGRPKKPLETQSKRTEQNKRARFLKDIKNVETRHERSVHTLTKETSYLKLGKKVPSLLKTLPPVSPFRRGVIRHFAQDENPKEIASLLGISIQSVREIQKSSEGEKGIYLKYRPGVTRKKVPDTHIQKIQDIWHDHTYPIPWKKTIKYVGKKDKKEKIELPYYSQHNTDSDIMAKFKEQTGLTYCNSTLLKYKPTDIHIASQQFCVCHHCRDGHDSKVNLETLQKKLHRECEGCSQDENCPKEKSADQVTQQRLKSLRDAVRDYTEHKEIADHQANQLVKMKEELKEGECLVVEDFAGRFLIKSDLQLSQEDFFARKGVPDLVLFAYYKKQGRLEHQSFDIISKVQEKDDFGYLRSAWMFLLNELSFFDHFQKIIIFSDGGPKHFKIRKSLYLFSLISACYNQEFEWNFFQSCHGKGPCDAHVGYLKRCLKREVLRNDTIETEQDLLDLFEKTSKVNPAMIDIDRSKNWDCSEMKLGIKKFFSFHFTREQGEIHCFRKTGDTEFVHQKMSSDMEDFLPFHPKQVRRAIPMDLE